MGQVGLTTFRSDSLGNPGRLNRFEIGGGREAGEVPRLIAAELTEAGAPAEAISFASSELDGVRQALDWARRGDLLLVLAHEARDEVLELLRGLEASGWRPGRALPSVV